jgi:hypothetical protein
MDFQFFFPFCTIVLALAQPSLTLADEPYQNSQIWESQGYLPIQSDSLDRVDRSEADTEDRNSRPWQPNSLIWPVEFQDPQHSLGNSMAEFQSYGSGPYYHGGLDLRVVAGAEVRTPVSGRIEAGHYGYSNRPDGSSTKYWRPWPASGSRTYFEVAVITDDGYRFEFHHMDEDQLAPDVLTILRKGSGKINAGATLGRTIPWPDGVYHHLHYNILAPSQTQLNPEYYSPLIDDHLAPEILEAFAIQQNGAVTSFSSGVFRQRPAYFALVCLDHQDHNVYDHPPAHLKLEFDEGEGFSWDFRERLTDSNGRFPPIWDFFIESLLTPVGTTLRTEGGYGIGQSIIRVPVPSTSRGGFTLTVADLAGNKSLLRGRIDSQD